MYVAGVWECFKKEALREDKPLEKGTLELFLIIARLVCDQLELPLAIGSIGLGQRLRASVKQEESLSELRKSFFGLAVVAA